MDTRNNDADWQLLESLMPAGWEAAAVRLGAFVRARQVRSPGELLRLVLASGGVGLSYQRTSEVAALSELGEMSKVAVWKRVQRCEAWLAWAVAALLAEGVAPPEAGGYQPRAVDGSIVAGPQAKVQLRLHYVLDLLTLRPCQVQVTALQEGESLARLEVTPQSLWIGDRGFARVKNVAWVKAGGGEVLVRLGRRTLRLYDADGAQVDPLVRCRGLDGDTPGECEVWCETPEGGRTAGRLVMLRLSEEVRQAAARKLRRTAARKQPKRGAPNPETVEMAGYLCLFCTAPAERLGTAEVLAWYRARWQVELAFKRLKSLLRASELRATSAARGRIWLLAKMLYALLLEAGLAQAGAFSPGGGRSPAVVAAALCAGVGLDAPGRPGDDHGGAGSEPDALGGVAG